MKDDIYSLYSSKLDLKSRGVANHPVVSKLLALSPYTVPLKNYCIYSGDDPTQAARTIAAVAEPRDFRVLGDPGRFYMEISRAKLGHSQIGITYNSEPVHLITPGPIKHYSLSILLAGTATYKLDNEEITIEAPQAFFLSAGAHLDVARSTNHLAIILALSIPGFENFIGDEIDLLATPEAPFHITFNMPSPQLETFCSLLGSLFKLLNESVDHQSQQDLAIARTEEAVWYKLFSATPDIYKAHRKAQAESIKSAPVKRVVDYVMEHAERELTMQELVQVSGSSLRSLHAGFSESYGIGPMAFVKKTKLTRCREQLLAADPSATAVGDIAAHWGFFHLSNFARYYRLEFGELPSETLKRSE